MAEAAGAKDAVELTISRASSRTPLTIFHARLHLAVGVVRANVRSASMRITEHCSINNTPSPQLLLSRLHLAPAPGALLLLPSGLAVVFDTPPHHTPHTRHSSDSVITSRLRTLANCHPGLRCLRAACNARRKVRLYRDQRCLSTIIHDTRWRQYVRGTRRRGGPSR